MKPILHRLTRVDTTRSCFRLNDLQITIHQNSVDLRLSTYRNLRSLIFIKCN